MKISFDREEMVRALGLICGVIQTKPKKDILKNALIKAIDGGSLDILATDLEVGIRCRVRAKVEGEPQDICLPAPAMLAELKESTEKTSVIEIMPGATNLPVSTDGGSAAGSGSGKATQNELAVIGKATMRLGRDVFEMSMLDPSEFPEVPAHLGGEGTKVPADDLGRMIRRCIFAAGKDEARYAINGVYMNIGAKGIEMVATDGRRMALVKKRGKMKEWQEGVIIPTKVLAELQSTIGAGTSLTSEAVAGETKEDDGKRSRKNGKKDAEAKREIEIGVRGRTILFSLDGVTYSSTLIAGNFPRYEDIIPKSLNYKITFVRRELESALRKALHFVNREAMTVRFEFESELCTIRAQDHKTGSAKVMTDIECEGNPKSPLAFNPQFLLDAVGVLEEDKVTIEFSDADRPAVIREGQDYVYVVMPLRA